MGAWSGPFLIAAVLLAVAGVAKAIDPVMTVGALRSAGIPAGPTAVRLGGAVEALIAVGAAITGDRVLALVVAASYLAFAGFVAVALIRHLPVGSCGCFGRADSPPSVLHVVVDVGAAVSAIAVARLDGGGLGATLHGQPLGGLPFVLLVGVGVYAAITALTVLPPMLAPVPAKRDRR
ncbi:MAG: MauE/DoxX family redox-associated membrane protein [Acidimicrobiia bacterium]